MREASTEDLRQEGLTLVEVMVALMIMGVMLAAVAGSLVSLARASGVNEYRVQATAHLTALHEAVQGIPWDRAVLYEDDVAELATLLDGNPDLLADFDVDLDASDPRFDGEPIATMPGPVNINCPVPDCGRLPHVPRPHENVTIDGRDFELFQFITERQIQDQNPDSPSHVRRFVTIVRWELLEREYQEVFESQRAPTPADIRELVERDVRLFLVSPRVIELDQDGRNLDVITVMARFRPGITAASVDFPVVTGVGSFNLKHDSGLGASITDRSAWEETIAAGELALGDCDGEPSCEGTVALLGTGPDALEVRGERRITLVPHDESDPANDRGPPAVSVTNLAGSPLHVGVEGAQNNVLCGPFTLTATAHADPDDVADALSEDPEGDGLTVTAFFSAQGNTSLRMELVGGLTTVEIGGEERKQGQFTLTLDGDDPSPWFLQPDTRYRDRFYVIAESGDAERRFSTFVKSTVIEFRKQANGQCP